MTTKTITFTTTQWGHLKAVVESEIESYESILGGMDADDHKVTMDWIEIMQGLLLTLNGEE